jgi:hypothetical protein
MFIISLVSPEIELNIEGTITSVEEGSIDLTVEVDLNDAKIDDGRFYLEGSICSSSKYIQLVVDGDWLPTDEWV